MNDSVSRRDFFKVSAAGSVGAALLGWQGDAQAVPPPTRWDREADVVVIGAGLAGYSAAIEAHTAGASVVILDKRAVYGGNSTLAGGGYNAADPVRQKALGIEDSPGKHFEQTLAAGDFRADPVKVRYLAEHALEGWTWLETLGVQLERPIFQIYGSLWPRTHQPKYKDKTIGAAYIAAVHDRARDLEIPLLLEHRVTGFVREQPHEGRVLGVAVEADGKPLFVRARRAVVLASGGFAADKPMRALHDPRLVPEITVTGHEEATGECIRSALAIGAYLVGMDHIQCLPGAPPGQKERVVLHFDVSRYIMVGKAGKRIVAEDARRDVIRDAILAEPEKFAFTIVDADGFAALPEPPYKSMVNRGLQRGTAWQGDTVEELAARIGVTPALIAETVKTFNEYVDRKNDPELKRAPHNLVHRIQKPPFYSAKVGVSVHHTMGGVQTEAATCKVVDFWGKVIPGFYAAGEVTGGVHGSNRVGGNALADCVVFGRTAGRNAAAEAPWG
jgi:flavocytochrome c